MALPLGIESLLIKKANLGSCIRVSYVTAVIVVLC
jgi:hypothetical protein